ncbi:MAG: methyltransferase family protein [bacterium]
MIKIKSILLKYHQPIINIFLFICIGHYIYRETHISQLFRKLDIIDITFFIHNIIFLAVILIRKEYITIDKDWGHWIVVTLSFFSNLFFIKSESSRRIPFVIKGAGFVNAVSILVGILSLISLGRSFGIVPAVREIKTGGLYKIIRHPMYLSDILFKIPIVMKYLNLYNIFIFIASVLLYILRAGYEEHLLMDYTRYSTYMHKVKYRFIPRIY